MDFNILGLIYSVLVKKKGRNFFLYVYYYGDIIILSVIGFKSYLFIFFINRGKKLKVISIVCIYI